jgi:RHS repeat-associated protein
VLPTNPKNAQADTTSQQEKSFTVSPPAINLPKGGGAIRGIGEKFAANPVTGTGSMTVPIATSPGRSGFGPQLSLSYDSGSGNGPFGFGWSLSLPSITRKTDKGLPKYQDAEETDVFILSGAEDLVPTLVQNVEGQWVRESVPPQTVASETFNIQRYRPRIEGLFARIEKWTDSRGDVHWRSISKDNILTLYGKDTNSRIYDPDYPQHIFSWLICETRDNKGNAVLYEYKAEDGEGVDLAQAHERNRGGHEDLRRTANRYLKCIYYGNRATLLDKSLHQPRFLSPTQLEAADWMFKVVFDYDEGHYSENAPDAQGRVFATAQIDHPEGSHWRARQDCFSTYRAGFEVRTYRLCRRVLMFHHFPNEPGVGNDCLVRSTDFTYSDEQDPASARQPVYTFLRAVTQTGYKRDRNRYRTRSLPPVEFEYSQPIVQDTVNDVDVESMENLPIGLDGTTYLWTDLHGEGIPGILTEQGGVWFYKRNISPINPKPDNGNSETLAKFSPVELVMDKPNLSLSAGAQFMDLAGDGQPDFVVMNGAVPGLYEHDLAESWHPFQPFSSRVNRDLGDPNLKFVDLDGDGHADVLITENDAFVWHPSLAEEGFGPAYRVAQKLDEEEGPRLVFADGTQSVYLADLSGDGLTDLVRIRNGKICYWPNLGYGHFGAKVTMDNAPWFDAPDHFDQRRIRLADIDGTGTTDLIYLHGDGVRLYFNQSGNSWSEPRVLNVFPHVDNLVSITPADLLGNGTACLVWSSPLPGHARQAMRYVNLIGGQKPHLLIKTINNLGAETTVEYVPSTKFYLQDKLAGKPWITRLPFPVHCVERVTVHDKWREATFSTTYSYHHGYFDGVEREFRGFGRVEQIDVESYDKFTENNIASPYITNDHTLYQPPVKTVTWLHTGAFLNHERILSQFSEEYFSNWIEEAGLFLDPDYPFSERALPEPDLIEQNLSAEEWREALRACKGMTLRQEIYELEVDALQAGQQVPVRLFSSAYHNCRIDRLQPQANNRQAVFLVTESEALTYHYELELSDKKLKLDPRIEHSLVLKTNEYGQPLQSVVVGYRRVRPFQDTDSTVLPVGTEALIREVQKELHLGYTEIRYTTDDFPSVEDYRLPVPCEVSTYELTGIRTNDEDDQATPDRWDDIYFTLDELRSYRLSEVYQTNGAPVEPIPYHQLPEPPDPQRPELTRPQKRLVERVRTLFFHENLTIPLEFGSQGRLGLVYEQYRLALTTGLLDAVLGTKLDQPIDSSTTVRNQLDKASICGYLSGPDLAERFKPLPRAEVNGQYWIRSGTAGFAAEAAKHFFLPDLYRDPFGNETKLTYHQPDYLFSQSSTDARGNTTSITQFDFRVLAPREMLDSNDNRREVHFDVLGMVIAAAEKGKENEADNLDDYTDEFANPSLSKILSLFELPSLTPEAMRQQFSQLLGNATTRFLYHFGETIKNGRTAWVTRPSGSCAILREVHVAQPGGATSSLQIALECSDGLGSVLMKKVQAEPDPERARMDPKAPLRWIVNGKTVLNNKGKQVKQYEPYFSAHFGCEAVDQVGVTPIMYYDAVGRLIRTEMPDGTFSRVEFSSWHTQSYDANDTVLDSTWYDERKPGSLASPQEKRAASLTADHANSPTTTYLDSLGREVVTIAHNQYRNESAALVSEKYVTYTKLDAEGKPWWIRDARGNLVMQYITPPKANNDRSNEASQEIVPCYDIAGNLLFQHSMDAGERWILMDAADKPMFAWDRNTRQQSNNNLVDEQRLYFTEYDALHRPTAQWLRINDNPREMVERYEYRDTNEPNGSLNSRLSADRDANLLGQAARQYDPSGLLETIRRDFKGNAEEVHRTLCKQTEVAIVDWQGSTTNKLGSETFIQSTQYDALNRMVKHFNWHRGIGSRVAVSVPKYNQRGLLLSEQLTLRAEKTAFDFEIKADTKQAQAIQEIRYNSKGQKEYLKLGNGTITRYDYDEKTFRLRQLRTERPVSNLPFPHGHSNLRNDRILQQLHYTYDPVGNITEIVDEAYQPSFFQNQEVKPENQYEYDALYQLICASGRENGALQGAPIPKEGKAPKVDFPVKDPQALRKYTQTYRYDPVGNIERMRHEAGNVDRWTRWYSYAPDSNRLLRTWEGADDPDNSNARNKTTYEYDAHGNMLNLADVPDDYRMRWDHRDIIANLNIPNGTAYYQYDADKQRTRKRIINQTNLGSYWERIYLGGYELYRRYNGNGTTLVEEIESHHLFQGEQRVLLVDDVLAPSTNAQTLFRYQYSNHLGSSCLEIDNVAGIISYEEYHPYGTSAYRAMRSNIEAPPKRYRFTGMERDEESGLSYHIARYYSPLLGRWTSFDGEALASGLDRYVAMKNSPVIYYDPNGMDPVAAISAASSTLPVSTPLIINPASGAGAVATGAQLPASGAGAVATGAQLPASGIGAAATGQSAVAAPVSFGAAALGGGLLLLLAGLLVGGAIGASKIGEAQQSPEWKNSVAYYAKLSAKSQSPQETSQPFGPEPPKSPKEAAEGKKLRAILLGETHNVKLPGAQGGKGPKSAPGEKGTGPKHAPGGKGTGPKYAPSERGSGLEGGIDPKLNSDQTLQLARRTPEEQAEYDQAMTKFGEKNIRVIITTNINEHHIATNKDKVYTPLFEKLFEGAGLTLNDESNLVSIEGHKGPHPDEYHEAILKKLTDAVKGLEANSPEYAKAFRDALAALKKEVARIGSDLNDIIAKR